MAVFADSYVFHLYLFKLNKTPEANQAYLNKEITWQGQVVKEPDLQIDKINLKVQNKQFGYVLVSAELGTDFKYGDLIKLTGKILIPKTYPDFDYRQYLAKDQISYVSYYPKIELLKRGQGNYLYTRLLDFKNKLRQIISKTLLPPQKSILAAFFLNDSQFLSDDLKLKLNITGTRHIIAISGMHMVIFAEILLFAALALGFWRQQAFYIVLAFLFLYIVMVGAPASAVRAGIMAFLLLLAQHMGRLNSAARAIIIAAALMLLLNPLLLKSDVGFQLSFMAVLGIIFIYPILSDFSDRWPNPFKLKDILIMTFAAQLAVWPLLAYHFGNISLISPLANLVIVPFSSFLMISAVVLSLTGLLSISLAKLIAWPVWFFLTLMLKLIDIFSALPLAYYKWSNFSWVYILIYYFILAIFIWRYKKPNPI